MTYRKFKHKIKNARNKLSQMLTGDISTTKWSSTRFVLILTVIISNTIVWGGIIILLILNGKFPDIPTSLISLYTLANGTAIGGKVTQKKYELRTEKYINTDDI